MNKRLILTLCGLLILGLITASQATDFSGTAKVGWIFTDEDGSAAVNQPTFNLFDGPALSLERFRLTFDNGLKMYGDLKNITLNNRNLKFGLTKPKKFGFIFNNYQYRHYYTDDGRDYTRRRYYHGDLWLEPTPGLKVFGGYGRILKKGTADELFEPAGLVAQHAVDYHQSVGNVGFTFRRDRRYFKSEYRVSKYTDKTFEEYDRLTSRLRFDGAAPVPTRDDLFVNAGYQHYTAQIEDNADSLFSNTFWGGAQWYGKNNISVKYSFLFDRSRRTGDITATDNILHAAYVTRTWLSQGGFTVGYRYQTTDDVWDEISQNGYFASAWYMATSELTLKAGWGTEQSTIEAGRTLEGEKNRTKFWAGLNYKRDKSGWNLTYRNRSTENDKFAGWDQGTAVDYPRGIIHTTDYFEIATDMYCENAYGLFTVGYSFSDGDYTYDRDSYKYREHVLSGDVETKKFGPVFFRVGATYLRAKEDLDYERTTLRFGGDWTFRPGHHLEVEYNVYNYDNYKDVSTVYTEYYTANVVRVNLVREL